MPPAGCRRCWPRGAVSASLVYVLRECATTVSKSTHRRYGVLRARAPSSHPAPRPLFRPPRTPHATNPSIHSLSRSAAPTRRNTARRLCWCAWTRCRRAVVVVVVVGLGLRGEVLLVRLDRVDRLERDDLDVVGVLGDGGHVLRRREHLEELRGGGGRASSGTRCEMGRGCRARTATWAGSPSPSTACISRRLADASGSPMINIFAPFAGAFAAIASACVPA